MFQKCINILAESSIPDSNTIVIPSAVVVCSSVVNASVVNGVVMNSSVVVSGGKTVEADKDIRIQVVKCEFFPCYILTSIMP